MVNSANILRKWKESNLTAFPSIFGERLYYLLSIDHRFKPKIPVEVILELAENQNRLLKLLAINKYVRELVSTQKNITLSLTDTFGINSA